MLLMHVAFEQHNSLLIMDAPSNSSLLALFRDIEIGLPPNHPLHLFFYDVGVMATDALAYDLRRPYSYFVIRTRNCNCAAGDHKWKTIHGFQLDSPLDDNNPDIRVYRGLCQLGKDQSQGEPPHARFYRRGFMVEKLRFYPEESASEFIDLANFFYTS
jgi:hypothetical protein